MEITAAGAFWVPKSGNSPEEYEDAFALNVEFGRFAVADGASESSFARQWARLLVDTFLVQPPAATADELREWVKPLQQEWSKGNKVKALSWYAEEKSRGGAFSSFLAMTLDAETDKWQAMAIGDSCLFSVRGKKNVVTAFPLSRSEEFHNRPMLLSSEPKSNQNVWGGLKVQEGDLAAGDAFFLMTDALAAWFLTEAELRRRPWAALLKVRSQKDFTAFIDLLRASQALRNDDVTLVLFEVG